MSSSSSSSVRPGQTYLIKNQKSGLVLGVSDASTSKGANVVQWPFNGSSDQAWIAETESGGSGVLFCNVKSNLFLGVADASKAAGAHLTQWPGNSSPDQNWLHTATTSSYGLIKNVNSGLVIGVANASTDKGAQVVQWTANGSSDQNWILQPTLINWMSQITGTKKISELTIPGTHDSCATKSACSEPDVFCQTMDLATQLNVGIRFIDIRCRQYKDGFAIQHGSYYLGLNFGDVQNICVNFLKQYPTECIIMHVCPEYNADDNTLSFAEIFNSYVNGTRSDGYNTNYSSFWYFGTSIPTLNDVRGKIVLLREFSPTPCPPQGIDVTQWASDNTVTITNSNQVKYSIQDHYNVSTMFKIEKEKWGPVQDLLNAAKNGTNGTDQYTLYLNFTSCSGGAYPETFATGKPGDVKGVNQYLSEFLSPASQRWGTIRWGIIISDFPENQNLVPLVISCNGLTV